MYQSDAPVKVLVAGDQFETVQVLEICVARIGPRCANHGIVVLMADYSDGRH